MTDVRVEWDRRELDRLGQMPEVVQETEAAADGIAAIAAMTAPRDTGEGAESIGVIPAEDGLFDVSWDREHFYMVFHDQGTAVLAASPILIPAAEAYNHT